MGWLRASLGVSALLALTGLGLMFYYVPNAAPGAAAGAVPQGVTFGGLLRGTHFWASFLLGPLLLVWTVVSLARRSMPRGEKRTLALLACALLLAAAALWLTGLVLPWDALSYWLRELEREHGISLSLRQIYWIHVILLPLVFGVLAVLSVRRIGASKAARR